MIVCDFKSQETIELAAIGGEDGSGYSHRRIRAGNATGRVGRCPSRRLRSKRARFATRTRQFDRATATGRHRQSSPNRGGSTAGFGPVRAGSGRPSLGPLAALGRKRGPHHQSRPEWGAVCAIWLDTANETSTRSSAQAIARDQPRRVRRATSFTLGRRRTPLTPQSRPAYDPGESFRHLSSDCFARPAHVLAPAE
jgi:hypothetical protein